ncbi:MgtC/SapB family protein [Weissella koreensis]|uniref:Magnesium transporter n=1 Tax=Weissella koreensis TaxID=165096 RepID=A0A7H1MLW8_9LACO|nr:MgtC/SapB family protein [Weissella koreensis]AEJ23624.1 Mg2 transporter-C (MgtC) family protein [Weissella koreensis KACC 15510]AVH75251.1 magnesium transporter [Weissella koreensis]EJF33283.1 MgtC family magnesium (Mg2+) transporter-C [Weissella koreensis KCTC 3621]MCZ9311703.1 MgtC/SapB family protein [Weissella koreensis]QGN20475.1 magnesium transporter [Weissella koreensis]
MEFNFIIKLLLSVVLGIAIGLERQTRFKSAGVRTHALVSLGGALVMIISKYGFMDLLNLNNIALDPSRIAAQVVSGIGFLGAGLIIVKGDKFLSVSGLTTAAGVWVTSGIGMAVGADMYILAISGTVIIIILQLILYKFKDFNLHTIYHVRMTSSIDDEQVNEYLSQIRSNKFNPVIDAIKLEHKQISTELTVVLSNTDDLIDLKQSMPNNIFIEITGE